MGYARPWRAIADFLELGDKKWRPTSGPPAEAHRRRLLSESSRLVLFEALERRQLLSADLIPITGSIDAPGEVDRFTFTLTDPKRIYFDSQTMQTDLQWSLTGPDGQISEPRNFTNSDSINSANPPIYDLVVGDYTLSIEGAGGVTGSYQFRLLDLANAAGVTPGTPVSGTLEPGNETDIYRFDAVAGDRVFLDIISTSGSSGSFWIRTEDR